MIKVILAAFCLTCSPHLTAARNIKLGYLYIQGGPGYSNNWGASWVQESFSQFKLGILDVNSNTSILPDATLTFDLFDTEGSEEKALQGAMDLISQGVVGIIGTGYSSALELPGAYCSIHKKPIVSPGSTAVNLVDKTRYPYVMRSISNDGGTLKAMVAIIYDLGWRIAVIVVNKNFEQGAIQVLRPAMQAASITHFMLVYDDPDDSNGFPILAHRAGLLQTMKLIKGAGHRIIAAYMKTMDIPGVNATAAAAGVGFASLGYVWVVSSGAWTSGMAREPQVLCPIPGSTATAMKEWYDERWTTVAKLFDASLHGGYDPLTGLPFFGVNATSDMTVWDTDYSQKGDGEPDTWGTYVYDTVWLYAHALHALIVAGEDIYDGEVLRKQLLNTRFEGITGDLQFDHTSQDRMQSIAIMMSSELHGAHQVGMTTEEFASWDLSGPCWRACTTLGSSSLAWPGGQQPTDGRALDIARSAVVVAQASYLEGGEINIVVQARNSFGRPPCDDLCVFNTSHSLCVHCLAKFAAYDKLVPIFKDNSSGEALQPMQPLEYEVTPVAGKVVIKVPKGLSGAGKDNRAVILSVMYGRLAFPDELALELKSTACNAGFYWSRGSCTMCRAGSFTAGRGLTQCKNCTAGKFLDMEGATECTACSPGFASIAEGSQSCIPCPVGTFSMSDGASACTECVTGRRTRFRASTLPGECICRAGSYEDPTGACLTCPDGMSCLLGSSVANFNLTLTEERPFPTVNVGHWASDANRVSVYKCKPKTNGTCPGGVSEACDGGHVGFLCNKCPPGQAQHEGSCKACSDWKRSGTALVLTVMVVVIIIVYYTSNGGMYVNSTCELVLASIVGMTITMFQIVAMCDSFSVPWQRSPETESVMSIAAPFGEEFEVIGIECLSGYSPVASFFVLACYPAVIAVGVLFCYLLSKFLPRITDRLDSWHASKTWNSLGTMYLVLFISMLTVCCRPLSLFDHPNGQKSVVMYPTVLAGSREHWTQLTISLFVFLFMLLPFTAASFYGEYVAGAHTLSDRMRVHVRELKGDIHLVRFRFLFYRFRPPALWWGTVLLIRQSLLALAPSIPSSQPHLQVTAAATILIVYGTLAAEVRPWKSHILNTLDVCQSVFLSIFLLTSTAFMDRARGRETFYTGLLLTQLSLATLTIVLGLISLFLQTIRLKCKRLFTAPLEKWSFWGGSQTPENNAVVWKSLCEKCALISETDLLKIFMKMPAHDFEAVMECVTAWNSMAPDIFPRTVPPQKRLVGLDHSTRDEDGASNHDIVAEVIHRTRKQNQDHTLGITFTVGIDQAVDKKQSGLINGDVDIGLTQSVPGVQSSPAININGKSFDKEKSIVDIDSIDVDELPAENLKSSILPTETLESIMPSGRIIVKI